ncbi:MAG: two-component system, OmpR family, response regulator [Propionibacteriaceae bacterium]|jgi:two-component system OmpR family response regulator|nr:two component transcriptional regulator, winged helix family [Propionibacteriaceae bacterium]MDX6323313.1 two-component system, OmpR family, response regulator [Propionibacteriaceae bacterium]
MRILVAEDEVRLASLLEQSLTEAGWTVDLQHSGRAALDAALDQGGTHDVLLLDWMLPEMDGVSVCRRLRELGVRTPVLMLTARTTVVDRVSGLDAGADDYVVKPFDLDELLARLRALHRRAHTDDSDEGPLRVADLVLDARSRRTARGEVEIELSAREFAILQLLLQRAGQLVTRSQILDEVWDGETDLRSNVIDVHVASLRAKIDRPFGTDTITTLRGAGYRIDGGNG